MATIPKTGIVTGQAITTTQILNIIEALDGTNSTDVSIKGALSLPGFADVSASLAEVSGSSFTSPFTAAGITGSFAGGTQFGTTSNSATTFGRSNQTSSFVGAVNQFIDIGQNITAGYQTTNGGVFGNQRFEVSTFSNYSSLKLRGNANGLSQLNLENYDTFSVLGFNANQTGTATSRPFYIINDSNELSNIAFRGATENVDQFRMYINNTVTDAAPSINNGGLYIRGSLNLGSEYANKAGTGGWENASDSRYKESIIDADLDICYNNIKNLKLKKYSYKEEILQRPNTDTHTLGWIAQDVETIYPKSIRTSPFTTWVTYNGNTPIYASNGIDIIKPGDRVQDINAGSTIIPDFKTMTDTQIMNSLYGAVQKLQSTTELLQTQVSSSSATILSQQTRIEALEAQINGEM